MPPPTLPGENEAINQLMEICEGFWCHTPAKCEAAFWGCPFGCHRTHECPGRKAPVTALGSWSPCAPRGPGTEYLKKHDKPRGETSLANGSGLIQMPAAYTKETGKIDIHVTLSPPRACFRNKKKLSVRSSQKWQIQHKNHQLFPSWAGIWP